MKTTFILKLLHVLSWIIFIGLSIEAGGFIFNTLYVLLYTHAGAARFWTGIDLHELYHYSQSHFISLTGLMIIATFLKAMMFYLIVKMFHDKKLDISKPFNQATGKFIINIGYIALGIGIFSFWGSGLSRQLTEGGLVMPDIRTLRLDGGDVWLFMSVILLVIAHVFKRGVELQSENELTI